MPLFYLCQWGLKLKHHGHRAHAGSPVLELELVAGSPSPQLLVVGFGTALNLQKF